MTGSIRRRLRIRKASSVKNYVSRVTPEGPSGVMAALPLPESERLFSVSESAGIMYVQRYEAA